MTTAPVQTSFDELGTPLRDVVFVVVDLETTGGSPESCEITEIGAVKVRGGEVLGEFQTLVRPTGTIPPFIAVLTGITDALVAGSPSVSTALPAFLEFARGAVLVAHNAPFDVGFLRRGAARLDLAWPGFTSVDTARLARRALTRDEAPNCKLATLARLFHTTTEPCHRALSDARATVGVLHGLLERVGNLGVQSLEELCAFSAQVPERVRRKRYLAEGLPTGPGVYVFRDAQQRPLYVGKSSELRSRVRSYFTAAETRTRMVEMVALAERVDAVPCSTGLEAEVRELRLIAELQPRYNRSGRNARARLWIKMTVEPFPRLSLVRTVRADQAVYLGPFRTRRPAEQAMNALHEAVPLRRCTLRLTARTRVAACALAGMGRCGAPCDGREDAVAYDVHVQRVRLALTADPGAVITVLLQRIERLAHQQRYEQAAVERDRLAVLVHATRRLQRLISVTQLPELVAARPHRGGWDLAVVRYGRLTAAGHAPRGQPPGGWVDAAVATAETVRPGAGPTPAASAEETDMILRWLELPGTRLVRLTGTWTSPAYGAGRFGALAALAQDHATSRMDPFIDRRALRPIGPAL